ncbi:MAG: hypothetical protein ABI569_12700 [Casimicrobiaceae bacterium]
MGHRLHNRLSRWHRRAIYLVTGVLMLSGLAWLAVVYLLALPSEPTPAPQAYAGPLLAIHGIVAYVALVAYGLVGHTHMRTGWRVPALRVAAFWLCATLALLVGTGLGFYYVAAEAALPPLRWTHVAAGLFLPFVLALHIVRGRWIAGRV